MPDCSKLDQSAQAYFNSLPTVFQEQIMHSGVEVTSKEDLERVYQNLLEKGKNC